MNSLAIELDKITIKPITNEADFQETSALIDALVDADLLEDPDERKRALDLLETLTVLAIDYEKRHYAIPRPDPIEAIKQRMEQQNLTQKDVAPYFGGENLASEVLNRKRSLTLNMIRALHRNLGIPAETLLAE
mgnify:FL=1